MAVFQGGGSDNPQLVLGSVLDYFTSALLAYGVAAALFKRERSGVGQYLSLSLLRSALTIQAGRFVDLSFRVFLNIFEGVTNMFYVFFPVTVGLIIILLPGIKSKAALVYPNFSNI
jgi:crotonobetainyl-CoA:carnitine CoA-transferase CaiB-like acyl-CoA transferase